MKLITGVIAVAIVYSLVVIVLAILSKHQNNKARFFFIVMMFSFTSVLAELAVFEENNREWFCSIITFSAPLSASIPVFFYLYFKSSLRLNSHFNWDDSKHLLFPLFNIVLMIPYYMLDTSERIDFFIYSNDEWLLSLTPTRFTRLAIAAVGGFFYYQLAWRELHLEFNQKKIDILREIKKLKITIYSMSLCAALLFVFFLIRLPEQFTWILSMVIIALMVIASLIFIYLPIWGHHWWKSSASQTNINPDLNARLAKLTKADVKPKVSKKYRSSVTSQLASETLNDLNALLETGIYKDATLSLRLLASKLNISNHHLSQIINEQTPGSYYDLINRYRITEAKRLLIETQMSVIDITYEVGFNSKSSFYSEFKRQAGLTPGQFKKKEARQDNI